MKLLQGKVAVITGAVSYTHLILVCILYLTYCSFGIKVKNN